MPTPTRFAQSRLSRVGLFLLLLSFVLGSSGLMTYRHYFRRPGEQAAGMIPSDALAVVTLDTNPNPGQVPLFKRISDALKAAGLNEQMDGLFSSIAEKSTLLRDVRPYVSDNYALALFNKPSKPGAMDGVAFIAVTDAAKLTEVLEKSGAKKNFRYLSYYEMKKEGLCAIMRQDYLLLSNTPEAFQWADGVRMSRARPLASLTEYQEARAALPEDASLLVFVSPRAMRQIQGEATKAFAASKTNAPGAEITTAKWMALSVTLRETGVAFDYRVPADSSTMQSLKTLARIAPIDPDALKKLPAGAYTVSTLSQPGKYFDMVQETVGQDKKARREMTKELADFKKETGLSVTQDIVPAFNGDLTLAIYPDASHPDGIMDGVILISDANGADPAALAARIRALIEKESGKGKKSETIRFIPTQRDNATYWYLDAHSQKTLTNALGDLSGEKKPAAKTGKALRKGIAWNPGENDGADAKPYMDEKTVAYAQVGKSVLIATSKAMLAKAVAAYEGREPSLADDAGYAAMQQSLMPGSQSVMMVHLGHILARLQPTLKKSFSEDDSDMVADIVDMFGSPDAGMAIAGKYDGHLASGTVFLPLNYENLIDVMGKGAKKANDHRDNTLTRRLPSLNHAASRHLAHR